jgi:hypothetical protein
MKFLISEEEKSRILGMHQNATSRQYLNEAADGGWMATALKSIEAMFGGQAIDSKFNANASYTTQNTYAAYDARVNGKEYVWIIPKGTTWSVSPSLTLLTAPVKRVNYSSLESFGNFDAISKKLNDGTFLASLAAGTAKDATGKTIPVADDKLAVTKETTNQVANTTGLVSSILYPSYWNQMTDKFRSL